MENNKNGSAPGGEQRIEQAETRAVQANTRTAEANTRTDQANTRTAEANSRTQQADLRTEKAEIQGEALRASELSYRRLFESARDGILILDVDTGRINDVNPFLVELLGYSHGEMVGKTVGELSPFKAILSNQAMLERLQNDGFIRYEDLPLETRDGRKIAVEFVSNVYQAGDIKVIQCNIRDITGRKQAAELLHRSEQRYRTLVETARDFIFTISSRGIVTSLNPEFFAATGWLPDACVGQGYEKLIQTGDLPRAQDLFVRALQGEVLPLFELRLNRQDGGSLPTEFTLATRAEDGQVVELLGIGRDITGRIRAEESLARLAMAVAQAAETIVITDTDANILYTNPAFEKITGYTRAEALGKNPRILQSDKHDATFYRKMWDALKRGEAWRGHLINRRKDGTLYEEDASISPVRDAAGKVVNYVAVKRDVTHEVQLEAQFRQSQKMDAIGHLAGGVAHDFNNILAVIQLQADLLKMDGQLSPGQLALAGEIGVATERAAALTRQLLLFSRKQTLQLRDLDLNQSLEAMTTMLRRILGEDIQMQFKFSAQPLFLHADAGMMDQVLMNLAVNSRDAMTKGGQLVIETAAVDFDESVVGQSAQARPGAFVCLSVSDIGCGIPPENLSRIFEPFFTTKDVGKGTGLGLATVFGIVQQHQGWVNVYSEAGQGTTFRIYLPRLTGMSPRPPGQPKPAAMRGGHETILLVEDDAILHASMHKILTHLGYQVLDATDGSEALAVWNPNRGEIKLLLTDLVLPGGINGMDLAARLMKKNPKLKVIYTSGYSAEVAGKDFPLAEGVNFLTKPFQVQKLAQIVRQRLDGPSP